MKRLWIVLLLLTGLSACSTKMSYYFLDWAIEWELAEYVDFNSQQSQAFEAILEPFLAWHRHQELPRYSQQLRQLRQELAEETLTPERWGEHVAQARDHWYRLFEHVFDDALPLFTSLSDSQVAQILEQLEEDEQELVEERQDKEPAELLEESDERLEELFSDWVGRLSETQKEWIHAYNRHRQSTWPLWIAYRQEWQRQFAQALLERSDQTLLAQRLRRLMTTSDELRSERHQAMLEENTENFGRLVMQLHQSLSERQQKHFDRKLNNLIEDLDELSQKPE